MLRQALGTLSDTGLDTFAIVIFAGICALMLLMTFLAAMDEAAERAVASPLREDEVAAFAREAARLEAARAAREENVRQHERRALARSRTLS